MSIPFKDWSPEKKAAQAALGKTWRKNNPEKWKAAQARAYAKKKLRLENDPDYKAQLQDAHSQTKRAWVLRRLYNLTPEDYDKMLAHQKGCCAICQKPPSNKRLHVDHCHRSGLIRGLLCWNCNRALGILRDKQELFFAAFCYLFEPPAKHALGKKVYGLRGKARHKKKMVYGGPVFELVNPPNIDPERLALYFRTFPDR